MYAHVATGTVASGIAGFAISSGLAPVHVAVVVGGSAAAMTGLVGLVRLAHGGSHFHRPR